MPNLQERWSRPASRRKDTSTTVISCETLAKVDWYSRRPDSTQVHFYSDADEEGDHEGKAVSDADDEHEGDSRQESALHEVEQKEGKGNVDAGRHSYGKDSSDYGYPLLPRIPPPLVHEKTPIPKSRESKKAERMPRTYPGAVPHSSNLLPHSGILLPSYMNMHPGGSFNTHAHHKGLASIKAATLIPSHIAGKSTNAGKAFNDAIEPSSPKVTCLGRVKIKPKCRREMEKLAELQALVLPNDKVSKKGINRGVASMFERGQLHSSVLSSAPAMAELKKAKHGSHREDMLADSGSDPEARVKKGIRKTLKEAKSHMKLHRERKPSLLSNASSASTCAAMHDEAVIDMGRFCSTKSMQEQESNLSNTLAPLSVGDYNYSEAGYLPHVPPPNSLLLMRNSKCRAACATLTSSLSRTLADSHEYGEFIEGESNASRHSHISLIKGCSSMDDSSSLWDGEVRELESAAMSSGRDGNGACLSELHLKTLCSLVAEECKPLQGKKNAIAHCQASLPKAAAEASLWQRRCVMKPSDLMVGRPIALQVNEPTTT